MKAMLSQGGYSEQIKAVHADQFYPTPDALADELVNQLDLRPYMRVLEPSGGNGQLIRAVLRRETRSDSANELLLTQEIL